MSIARPSTTELPLDGVARLRQALRSVWGVQFEDNVQAVVEEEEWYDPSFSVEELFVIWIRDNYERNPTDGSWLFGALRPADRKFLFDALGLDRTLMVGQAPHAIAERILAHVGLPCRKLRGVTDILDDWRQLTELVEADEAEKAATFGRQQGERLLKTLLYFYSVVGCAKYVTAIVKDPGTLRIPKALQSVAILSNGEADAAVISALSTGGWADLGFLVLMLRKLSDRLEFAEAKSVTGARLLLMTQQESETVDAFAKALQSYTHFNPDQSANRRDQLLAATRGMCGYVNALASRNVLPEEALVTEVVESVFGRAFRARSSAGSELSLVANSTPRPAEKVLVIARSPSRYAQCWWAPSVWNVAGPQE